MQSALTGQSKHVLLSTLARSFRRAAVFTALSTFWFIVPFDIAAGSLESGTKY